MPNVGVVAAIDRMWEATEKGPRPHLGASVVGKPCERQLVYSFRHAMRKQTEGRMLRLFNRGHREEPSICASLRAIGVEVREYAQRLTYHEATGTYAAAEWPEDDGMFAGDPLTGNLPPGVVDVTHEWAHVECARLAGVELRQWSFSDIGGHHAGSTDGKARLPLDSLHRFEGIEPGKWFGLEFKTYSVKSFDYMAPKEAIEAAKAEHYAQTQEYMHYMGLDRVLYLAVCKNDDRMYEEVVHYNERAAIAAVQRAARAIGARKFPPRISNSPTNQACRMCDYKGVCHHGDTLLKSCRTCANGVAVTTKTGAVWHCQNWGADIPKNVVPQGCPAWVAMTD
jgi:hypothetical protein